MRRSPSVPHEPTFGRIQALKRARARRATSHSAPRMCSRCARLPVSWLNASTLKHRAALRSLSHVFGTTMKVEAHACRAELRPPMTRNHGSDRYRVAICALADPFARSKAGSLPHNPSHMQVCSSMLRHNLVSGPGHPFNVVVCIEPPTHMHARCHARDRTWICMHMYMYV